MRGDHLLALIIGIIALCWFLDYLIMSDKRLKEREQKSFSDGEFFVRDQLKRGMTEKQLRDMITPGWHPFDKGMAHELRKERHRASK